MFTEDDFKETPGIVIAAIACGVAPVPFLVTYSAIFLMHGTIFPVDPPDITGSRLGEALCGVLALIYLFAIISSIGWFLSQKRRWTFLVFQLLSLGFALDFLLDTSKGDPEVPLLLVFTTLGALVLGLLPVSHRWVHEWRHDDEMDRALVDQTSHGSSSHGSGKRSDLSTDLSADGIDLTAEVTTT